MWQVGAWLRYRCLFTVLGLDEQEYNVVPLRKWKGNTTQNLPEARFLQVNFFFFFFPV